MDAELVVAASGLVGRVERFVERYLPNFRRIEQWRHFQSYLNGLLAPLPRKSVEPIADFNGVPARKLTRFASEGKWDDDALLNQLWREMAAMIGDSTGVLTVDGSQFPKKGDDSVGVARQWCGRLGKTENCQSGVFVGYVTPKGHSLADRRLYLPQEWAEDEHRRAKCHVPPEIRFQTSWEIALGLIHRVSPVLPHQVIVADEEFGRVDEFRQQLAASGEVYLVEVPSNRVVRDLSEPIPADIPYRSLHKPPFRPVAAWATMHWRDNSRWRMFTCRKGTKGPLKLWAAETSVQTRTGHSPGPIERLIVTKGPGKSGKWKYWLTNAPESLDLKALTMASASRYFIEQDFQRAKGEVGLSDYELRGWVGWHHHMTLCFLALWFLVTEQSELKKKCRESPLKWSFAC